MRPRPPRPHARPRALTAPALALAAVVLAVGAACGGDDDDGGDDLPPLDAAAEEGRQLAQDKGCVSCHSADGDDGTGPTWAGLWGSTVELEGGETVVVDRDYVARSVREPREEVVEGFNPVMPSYDLTDAEIDALVAYLEALADQG
ncbi:MAG TPA: cytochrome c [Acidimicrobiales bacterium]